MHQTLRARIGTLSMNAKTIPRSGSLKWISFKNGPRASQEEVLRQIAEFCGFMVRDDGLDTTFSD